MAAEKISKMEAVRRVLADNAAINPKDGVVMVLSKYGLDISEGTFSNYKSTIAKAAKGSPGRKPKAAAAEPKFDFPAPQPAAPAKQVGTSVGDVLEAAQKLIDDVGAAERSESLICLQGRGEKMADGQIVLNLREFGTLQDIASGQWHDENDPESDMTLADIAERYREWADAIDKMIEDFESTNSEREDNELPPINGSELTAPQVLAMIRNGDAVIYPYSKKLLEPIVGKISKAADEWYAKWETKKKVKAKPKAKPKKAKPKK